MVSDPWPHTFGTKCILVLTEFELVFVALGAMQTPWFPSAGAQEGKDDAVGREPCRLGTLLPEDHWLHPWPAPASQTTQSGFEPI